MKQFKYLPSSATLNVTTLKVSPKTNYAVAKNLLSTITSLYDPAYKSLDGDQQRNKCEEEFAQLSISKEEAKHLSKATVLQCRVSSLV